MIRSPHAALATTGGWCRSLLFVVACAALSGCTKSVVTQDAASLLDASDAADGEDAAMDAGTDGPSDFDAAGLACYPVEFEYVLQGPAKFSLYVGRYVSCDDFGFVATAAELTAAQTFGATCTMHATDEYWCAIPGSNSWLVAGSDYDSICDIEAALGPRRWICVYIE